MLWKLFGQGRCYVGSPLHRRRSDRQNRFLADRRRGDESDERLVLVVYDSGLDLSELRLENVLNGLCFDAVPADLELRVDFDRESAPAGFGCRFCTCLQCGRDGRTEGAI